MKSLTVREIVHVTMALRYRVELYQNNLTESQSYDEKYGGNGNNTNYWKEQLSALKDLLQEFEKYNIVHLK